MTGLITWQSDDQCPACGAYLVEISGPSSGRVIQQCRACAWSVTWAAPELLLTAVQSDCLAAMAADAIAYRPSQQQDTWLNPAPRGWPDVPGDPPRAALADPVTLRQAITELHAQLLAARAGLPAVDAARHQHLHFHGLTPEQAAEIITGLQARQDPESWQDGGSQ